MAAGQQRNTEKELERTILEVQSGQLWGVVRKLEPGQSGYLSDKRLKKLEQLQDLFVRGLACAGCRCCANHDPWHWGCPQCALALLLHPRRPCIGQRATPRRLRVLGSRVC